MFWKEKQVQNQTKSAAFAKATSELLQQLHDDNMFADDARVSITVRERAPYRGEKAATEALDARPSIEARARVTTTHHYKSRIAY